MAQVTGLKASIEAGEEEQRQAVAALEAALAEIPNLPLDEEDDENAAAYYNICRQRGIQATAIDLLICAVAVRHELKVFTTDTDFDTFERHLPIKRHRMR